MSEFVLGDTAELVTTTALRVPQIELAYLASVPASVSGEAWCKWVDAGGQETYNFAHHNSSDETRALWQEAERLIAQGDIVGAVAMITDASIPSYHFKDTVGKWASWHKKMPEDWGPLDPRERQEVRRNLTARARGVVLEAMCGFTAYIDNAPHIAEVVALDFCREALERYEMPDRKRVLFDMDSIANGAQMDFIADEAVDTVSITLGVNYLSDTRPVYEELRRILRPGGNVLIFGSMSCGYQDLVTSRFSAVKEVVALQDTGFTTWVDTYTYDASTSVWAVEYDLIEATKPR